MQVRLQHDHASRRLAWHLLDGHVADSDVVESPFEPREVEEVRPALEAAEMHAVDGVQVSRVLACQPDARMRLPRHAAGRELCAVDAAGTTVQASFETARDEQSATFVRFIGHLRDRRSLLEIDCDAGVAVLAHPVEQ